MAYIGRRNLIPVLHEAPQGLYLDGGPHGEILLPAGLVPDDVEMGKDVDVFLYSDSEDRLVATPEKPYVMAGQIACLKVVGVNQNVGAFLDWGLSKDLLLPYSEQRWSVRVGDVVVVYVYVDEVNNRIVATTKLKGKVSHERPPFFVTQEVDLIVTDETPMGYRVIVEGTHEGMLYFDELSEALEYGQQFRGFVRSVRPDGKIDVRRDKSGYARVEPVGARILEELIAAGGHLPFNDKSSPDSIRDTFGISKKAFKQAIGALYKKQRILITDSGIDLLDEKAVKLPRPPAKPRSRESGGDIPSDYEEENVEDTVEEEVDTKPKKPSPWDTAKPRLDD